MQGLSKGWKRGTGGVPGVLDLQPFTAELQTLHGGGTAKGREMSGCKLCLVFPCLQQIQLVSTTGTAGGGHWNVGAI